MIIINTENFTLSNTQKTCQLWKLRKAIATEDLKNISKTLRKEIEELVPDSMTKNITITISICQKTMEPVFNFHPHTPEVQKTMHQIIKRFFESYK